MTDDEFAVDIGALNAGGSRLGDIASVSDTLRQQAQDLRSRSDIAFGQPDDQIGAAARSNLGPTQDNAITVLTNLGLLVSGHGDQVAQTGQASADTDTSATHTAHRG